MLASDFLNDTNKDENNFPIVIESEEDFKLRLSSEYANLIDNENGNNYRKSIWFNNTIKPNSDLINTKQIDYSNINIKNKRSSIGNIFNTPQDNKNEPIMQFYKNYKNSKSISSLHLLNQNIQVNNNSQNIVHKVSLKNSLNSIVTCFSKFEINLHVDNSEITNRIIQIIFIVQKCDWANGKSKMFFILRNKI